MRLSLKSCFLWEIRTRAGAVDGHLEELVGDGGDEHAAGGEGGRLALRLERRVVDRGEHEAAGGGLRPRQGHAAWNHEKKRRGGDGNENEMDCGKFRIYIPPSPLCP